MQFATPTAIKNESPKWAKWMFRVTFIVTTAITGYVAATNHFTDPVKYEITLVLKLLVDPIVFGISKMFGVDPTKEEGPVDSNLMP